MALLGIGGGRTGQAVKDVRSALEQAEAGPRDEGVLGNQATRLVQNILDLGIDGKGWFHSAERVAGHALASHPDPEAAVDAIVRKHVRLGAASGFVTSVGGFITLPVALPANVLGFYLIATRMVEETEAFLEWEKGTMSAPTGSGGGAGGGASYARGAGPSDASNGAARPGAAQTVPGDVVR